MTNTHKIIFFGNGPLADHALSTLEEAGCKIVFHAQKKTDLEKVKQLKNADSKNELHGVLASFGVMIKPDILSLFEPEGILNIHPSLLPKYRGPSPIETAILNGDTEFGVSVMKLAPAMDAGPIYHQESFQTNTSLSKDQLYCELAYRGANWLAEHLDALPNPTPQNDSKATYTQKFDKSMSSLDPSTKTASELFNQIRAFSGFPKSKYTFYGLDCIIISAHIATPEEITKCANDSHALFIKCFNGSVLVIDQIQPAGRKIMDARSFKNGYAK